MSSRSWFKFILLVQVLGFCFVAVLAQGDSETHTLGPPSTDPACANPPRDSCAFYANCLESRYHCGPTGYPLGFGQRLCEKFSAERDRFSAEGQRWLVDVMQCLQKALVEEAIDIEPPDATTCTALQSRAYSTHPGCYFDTGYCTLPLQDWMTVLDIVGVGTLLSSGDAVKAAALTWGDCVGIKALLGRSTGAPT